MHVSALAVHPVKSCRAVRVERARVSPAGLEHDRALALANAAGEVLTQKRRAELARVAATRAGDRLELRADGVEPLAVDVGVLDAAPRALHLHGREHAARRVDDPRVAPWLERVAGVRAELFRPEPASAGAFVDLRPVHVVSAASVEAFAARLGRAVDVGRFRPNLVVAGAEPFAEDGWSTLAVGELVLEAVEHTGRCRMVGLDPRSGAPDDALLRALARWRHDGEAVRFGRYFVPRGSGELAVGAAVAPV